jgi:hypothetical protein
MTQTTMRPVVRETAVQDRGRPLVVAIHPRMIAIRAKGTHEWFSVPYDALFDLARKLAARSKGAA